MFKKLFLVASFLCLIAVASPLNVRADNDNTDVNNFELEPVNTVTRTAYMVKTQKEDTVIRQEPQEDSSEVASVAKDTVYEVLENVDDSWAKVEADGQQGYINTMDDAIVYESVVRDVDKESELRQDVVANALSFVGGEYVWGGEDPFSGVDCSGFTAYIMEDTAGVNLTHSSQVQAGEGREVSEEELKPGDLVFYGNEGIHHVAIYAGHDKIVHASSSTTGIILSDMHNGREPVKYVSVLDNLQAD